MTRKNILSLLLNISLSANLMVLVTWMMTTYLGYSLIDPTYLFKNVMAAVAIVAVSTIFG